MKQLRSLFVLLMGLMALLTAKCGSPQEEGEQAVRSVTPVTISNPRTGRMAEYTELTATSSFLVKAVIKSPVTGYVEKCSFTPGDRTGKGQLLFLLRTKEAMALQADSLTKSSFTGLIKVKASIDGVVSEIDHPAGDYVQEGDALCTIVLPESMVFLLDLPFELKSFVHQSTDLTLVLPGNEQVRARVKTVLPSMSGASQTQRVVLQPLAQVNLPENLIARVRIVKSLRPSAVILPKACILSDEVMKEFWVMKLVSDTLSVKVTVNVGIMNTDSAEVISPVLQASDRILSSGNYGIGDTAVVRILK